MQATILRQLDLPNLPSASGVEIVGDTVYIIGDDSPYLYRFSAADLTPGRPLMLFETAHFSTGRIDKALKADLECLAVLTTPSGETGLLVCGSGATTARENGFWVPVSEHEGAATVYPMALSGLYAHLRKSLPNGVVLNLEAVTATATELLFFQRTVGSAAGNLVFQLPLAPTLAYLYHQATLLPPVQALGFELPTIDGKPAGFSGACVHENELFVTASVEDTTDAILDGAVLGSFVGILNLKQPKKQVVPFARLQLPDGQPYRGKVESVAVRRQLSPGRYELLLVTDDDLGGSTAVLVEVTK